MRRKAFVRPSVLPSARSFLVARSSLFVFRFLLSAGVLSLPALLSSRSVNFLLIGGASFDPGEALRTMDGNEMRTKRNWIVVDALMAKEFDGGGRKLQLERRTQRKREKQRESERMKKREK